MIEILKKIELESISSVIEDNLCDYCIEIANKADRAVYLGEDICWAQTMPTCWPNYILRSTFTESNIDKRIDEVIALIKTKQAPAQWVVRSNSSPENLLANLENHGFKRSYDFTGMAIDLSSLDNNKPLPDWLTIKNVTTQAELKKWADVLSIGLFSGGVVESDIFEYMLHSERVRIYLAYYNGVPVATSMLYISSGVASVSMVATLPEFRKLGIGTVMTLKPLYEAKDLGYHIGVLQATKAGEPVYKKIGFKDYCTLHVLKLE